MVRAECTRGSGQFCTGSDRFEMCNTLRPGVSTLYGGLQGSSLVYGRRETGGGLSNEICILLRGCLLGLIYLTVGRYMWI
jgi:hypothetical protein